MQLVANFIHKSTCLYIVRNRTGVVNTKTIFPQHSSNEVNRYLSYDMRFIFFIITSI